METNDPDRLMWSGRLGNLERRPIVRYEDRCVFCKEREPLPHKKICGECIRGCVEGKRREGKCPSTGDLYSCPEVPKKRPAKCGTILQAGCLRCGRDRGYRFCKECAEFLENKHVEIDRIIAEAGG